jgi:hypothetical protein
LRTPTPTEDPVSLRARLRHRSTSASPSIARVRLGRSAADHTGAVCGICVGALRETLARSGTTAMHRLSWPYAQGGIFASFERQTR